MESVSYLLHKILTKASFQSVEHDPEWPSPAEIMPADANGMIRWRPTPINDSTCLDRLAIPPELLEFFGSYWGWAPTCRHSGEVATLLVSWNETEMEGQVHLIEQTMKLGKPIRIAQTDSDWYFGFEPKTEAIWLCEPGHPPIRKVSESVRSFLREILEPSNA